MSDANRIASRSIYAFAAIALLLAGCSSIGGAPTVQTPVMGPPAAHANRPGKGSQDLYIGNILGGVPLFSTGKKPHEVGDITDQLPRVTGVWVDQKGVLYAYTDNVKYPYETIEEFEPGATTPFFSLVVQHYGAIAVADSAQNVYAQATNSQAQSVIDVYPPGSQSISNEYVVPAIGQVSGVQGMAFDLTGALLVGVAALAHNRQGQVGGVFRLNAGSSTFVNLNLKKAYGGLIATDGAGNLYAGGGRLISIYAPGATIPARMIHTKSTIVTLTAAADGTLYVSTSSGGISVYAPGKGKPKTSFSPQAQISGLALGPG